jgi:hypothetical protein
LHEGNAWLLQPDHKAMARLLLPLLSQSHSDQWHLELQLMLFLMFDLIFDQCYDQCLTAAAGQAGCH